MAVPPARDASFTVFSQRPDARVDVGEWARHAERFFATRVTEEGAPDHEPGASVARVRLAPLREKPGAPAASGARVCWGRARDEGDLAGARSADAAGAGLAELAGRCPHVWLVETDERADDDVVALRLAAVLAGVMLGPILSPRGALFGPKTARVRLGV
jgi:hypothetical protein